MDHDFRTTWGMENRVTAQMVKPNPHSPSRVAVHVSVVELNPFQREAMVV